MRTKITKVNGKLKSTKTYEYNGFIFHNNFLQKLELKKIWQIRNDGGKPIFINLCSNNDPAAYLYIGASLNEINSGDIKMVGWSSNWVQTQEEYLSNKRGRGNPDSKFFLLIVFKIPLYKNGEKLNDQTDKKIQKILEKRGFQRVRRHYNDDDLGTELFNECPVGEAISAVYEFFGKEININRNWDAKFYEYQINCFFQLSNLILRSKFKLDYYFLVSPTRSGKSIMAGLTLKNISKFMGHKNYAIITPHPDGFSSFEQYFNTHVDADEFEIFNLRGLDLKEIEKKAKENEKNKINNIFFFSWAKLKNKSKRFNETVEFLKKMNIFGILIDEYHREADTEKSVDLIINKLSPAFNLGISATPYTEIMSGIANISNSIIIDENKVIKKWKKENNIPDYNQSIFIKDNLESIKEYLRKEGNFNEKEEFTFQKAFEVIEFCTDCGSETKKCKKCKNCGSKNSYKKLKYESAILYMLEEYLINPAKLIQGKHDNYLSSKLQNGKSNNVLDHILCYLPSSSSAILVSDLINKNFDHYKSISWTSNSNKQSKKLGITREFKGTENKINAWHSKNINNGFKTIITTCESLTTAVTLRNLSSVLLLKNISSVELFTQIIGRPNNSDKLLNQQDKNGLWIKRETGAIIPKGVFLELSIKMIPYGIIVHKNDDYVKVIREMYSNMNIFSFEGAKWTELSDENLFKNIREKINVKTIRLDSVDINKFKLLSLSSNEKTQLYDELYMFDSAHHRGTTKDKIGDGGNGGKTYKKSPKDGKNKNTNPDKINEYLESKIKNLFEQRFPFFCIIKEIKCIDDLFKIQDQIFEKNMLVSKETFFKLINTEIISKDIINHKLKFHNYNLKSENRKEGFLERFEKINSLGIKKIDKNVILDPPEIFNKIVLNRNLKRKLKRAKSIFILEKTGAITFSILKEIGYENFKKLHIQVTDKLCYDIITYLFGKDSKLLKIGIIENLERYIKKIESLKNMPKFDVIIGNPPYQSSNKSKGESLWPKFTLLCGKMLKDNGYLSLVIPKSWMTAGFNGSSRKGVYDDLFRNINLEYVNIQSELKEIFGVGSKFSYFIAQNKFIENFLTEFDTNDGLFKININEYPFLPINLNEHSLSIINKVIKTKHERFFIKHVHKAISLKSPDRSKVKTKKNKFKHWNIGGNYEDKIYFTYLPYNNTPDIFEINKVMFPISGADKFSPYVDMEGVGMAQQGFYIPLNENATLEGTLSIFYSDLFKYLTTGLRSSGYFKVNILKFLPKLDTSKVWSNKDIFDFFEINEEEREWIKTQI